MAIAGTLAPDYAGEAQAAEAALHGARSVVEAVAIRAAAHPAELMLVDIARGTRLSYGDLDARSTALAARLPAAGARAGEILALPLDEDLTDHATAYLAAMKAGLRPMSVPALADVASQAGAHQIAAEMPGGRAFAMLAMPAPDAGASTGAETGDALYDVRAGRALPRSGAQLRQVLAPRWPKLVPMLRGMAYSVDAATFGSALSWQCWRGFTGYPVAGQSIGSLLDAVQAHLLPTVIMSKQQFREAVTGPPFGQDVTSVRMAGLSFVTTVTKADAELVASRFPQAAGVAVPALDGRLRLLGARTGQAGAAQQPGSGQPGSGQPAADSAAIVRAAPVPPLPELLGEVPGAYVELLIGVLTRWVFDHEYVTTSGGELYRKVEIDRPARMIGRDWPASAETMIGVHRSRHLAACIARLIGDGVPGDLVEAGAWRGGSCILMRGVLKALGDRTRRVWAADSFQGFPEQDFTLASSAPAKDTTNFQFPLISVGLAVVRRNFERYGLLDDQVRFVPGWFHETLPGLPVDRIALLRVDGDLYDSTWAPLEALYSRLEPGGFCIVDDYGDVAVCREAVDEFRGKNGISEPIEWIDTDAVYWRKAR
jgi:O-methyltransferase